MGRVGGLGGKSGPAIGARWTCSATRASGTPDYTDGRDGDTTYFSSNGGSTLSDQDMPQQRRADPFVQQPVQFLRRQVLHGGDTADWDPDGGLWLDRNGRNPDADQTELEVMQALGWNLSLTQDVDGTSGSLGDPDRLEHRLHADRAAGRI